MNSQMKRYIGRVWELLEHRSFRPRGVGVPHPPGVDVFTHLDALRTLYNWDLMEHPHVAVINY